ncbi:CheR family methyltransferase [Deinococcus cellulosilyticus]|uniref:CheR-type methyltransferase domain-containing protein n=1 Tax=Deinococcus cellulosilyticus (strain DSM 18568 / NBRC 106333 / KACC 11606 / 5516J-15) TaxID=1223518 RepID=A0A511MVE9_DEIC1|nr:CheR family methyltransferase [Deinococcus cellulosilyticus]GEM44381.1 hypothetical protein DC3_00160 [Deinococcus cellulosilyticus NBRC 106333 = KACC 11606]
MSAVDGLHPALLQQLIERVEQVGGIRIQPMQHPLLLRALRELGEEGTEDLNPRVVHLLSLPDLLFTHSLIERLTIHETYFFRGEQQVRQLREIILPELQKRPHPVRVWSAGCSTGEEAYTLSILLKTEFGMQDALVFGTDLHPEAIAKARQGRYRAWSFRSTPESIQQQCFTHVGQCWVIKSFLKQHVHFGVLNLKGLPWQPLFQNAALQLKHLDLILCRNVTLYFGAESAQQVYRAFAEVLAPGGTLMLGATDPHPEPESGLHPERHPLGWVWKKEHKTATIRHRKVTPRSTRTFGPSPRQPRMHLQDPPQQVFSASGTDLPETLEGLRQHVFLHPDDPLALFQLAQAWIRAGTPDRAFPLLRSLRTLLEGRPRDEALTPELHVQELLTATLYTLNQMKGTP